MSKFERPTLLAVRPAVVHSVASRVVWLLCCVLYRSRVRLKVLGLHVHGICVGWGSVETTNKHNKQRQTETNRGKTEARQRQETTNNKHQTTNIKHQTTNNKQQTTNNKQQTF